MWGFQALAIIKVNYIITSHKLISIYNESHTHVLGCGEARAVTLCWYNGEMRQNKECRFTAG